MKEVGTFAFPLPPPFILMLRQCLSRRTLDSKKHHVRHGMCQNASRAETHGPLIVGMAFCACAKCLEFKYGECLVKQHSGQVRTVEVPRKKGERAIEFKPRPSLPSSLE